MDSKPWSRQSACGWATPSLGNHLRVQPLAGCDSARCRDCREQPPREGPSHGEGGRQCRPRSSEGRAGLTARAGRGVVSPWHPTPGAKPGAHGCSHARDPGVEPHPYPRPCRSVAALVGRGRRAGGVLMRNLMPAAIAALPLVLGACGADPVSFGTSAPFRVVEAGRSHTCGITEDDAVFCWGRNWEGQLGSSDPTLAPAAVPILIEPFRLTSVSAGEVSTCGVLDGGDAACWGNGTYSLRRVAEGAVEVATGAFTCARRPTGPVRCSSDAASSSAEVLNTEEVRHLAVGGMACGTDDAGIPFCWAMSATSASAVAGAPPLSGVSVGDTHACGVAADGVVWCWGGNSSGQLGDATTVSRADARPVQPISPMTFRAVSAGATHTCAIRTDGDTYCWGAGGLAQLGRGVPTVNTSRPLVAVEADVQFSTISAGGDHTCGITGEGETWCWGANESGESGSGDFALVPAPRRIAQ